MGAFAVGALNESGGTGGKDGPIVHFLGAAGIQVVVEGPGVGEGAEGTCGQLVFALGNGVGKLKAVGIGWQNCSSLFCRTFGCERRDLSRR